MAEHGISLPPDFDTTVAFDNEYIQRTERSDEETTYGHSSTTTRKVSVEGDSPVLQHATYCVVYEPMLQLNPISTFASRVSTLTGVEHKRACTYVPLSGESDAVLYSQQLADVVFGVNGAPETRLVRRMNTLHRNLFSLSHPVPAKIVQLLRDRVTDATQSQDALVDQEAFSTTVQRFLFSTTLPLGHRIEWTSFHETRTSNSNANVHHAVQHSLATTHTAYGFMVDGNNGRRPDDLLLTDIPASFTFVSHANNLVVPNDQAIREYYSQTVVPLFCPVKTNGVSSYVDTRTSVDRQELICRLNVSRHPLLLHQIFTQFAVSEDVPIATLWHKAGSLRRQIIRSKYYQDPHELQGVQDPDKLLYILYKKFAESRNSHFKMVDQPSKRFAHFLDIVVRTQSHAHIITFDTQGRLRCVVDGFQVAPFPNVHSVVAVSTRTSDLEESSPKSIEDTSFVKFVKLVVPKINKKVILPLNQIAYLAPTPGNARPTLLYLRMHYDSSEHRVMATHNTRLRRYAATHRQVTKGHLCVQLLYGLRYLLLPVQFNIPLLSNVSASNNNTSLHQCVSLHSRPAMELFKLFDGKNIHPDSLFAVPNNHLMSVYTDNEHLLQRQKICCTYMMHRNCPRFRVSSNDVGTVGLVRFLPRLSVQHDANEMDFNIDYKHMDIDGDFGKECQMHPHAFGELTALFVQFQMHSKSFLHVQGSSPADARVNAHPLHSFRHMLSHSSHAVGTYQPEPRTGKNVLLSPVPFVRFPGGESSHLDNNGRA